MELDKTKKVRPKRKSKIISFDEEVVTKNNAEEILKNEEKLGKKLKKQERESNHSYDDSLNSNFGNSKRKNKLKENSRKTSAINLEKGNLSQNEDKDGQVNKLSNNKKKRKHIDKETLPNSEHIIEINEQEKIAEGDENTEGEVPEDGIKPPKKESKRSKKRKKFEEQVAAKKLKAEVGFQEKALNYLSKWKHCKSEWKFEKLRQVWLQQNLFDTSKIPDEFWETTVEYFSGSQGRSRQQLLDEAVKIVEQEEQSDISVNEDKLKRARDIVQHLQ